MRIVIENGEVVKTKKVTMYELIRLYLIDNGYDGLCNDEECGCLLDDLTPCDGAGILECMPAYACKE
jgi:hypothetical protein